MKNFKLKIKKIIDIILLKDKNELIKKLFKKGFFHVLTGNALAELLAFVTSILVIRLTNSKSEYAYLSYANNVYSYIILLSGLGLSSALLKYSSSQNNPEYDKAYLKFTLKIGLVIQTILSIAVIVIIYNIKIPFMEAKKIIYLMVLVPFITYIYQVFQNYVRSKENNKLFAKTGIIFSIATLFFSIGSIFLYGIYGVPFAKYLAFIIAIILPLKFIKKSFKNVKNIKLSQKQKQSFIKMGLSILIGTFFFSIMSSNELFLVNNLLSDEVITSNYKVSILIPSQVRVIISSVMIFFFPILAKLKDNQKIYKLAKRINLTTFLIISLIAGIGIVLSPFIIRLFFGSQYDDTLKLTVIFWIVYLFNSVINVPFNILLALGRSSFVMLSSIIISLIHLLLTYMFIKLFGINGVAFSTLLSYVIGGIIYWKYLKMICTKKEPANMIPVQNKEEIINVIP